MIFHTVDPENLILEYKVRWNSMYIVVFHIRL